ncbi:MAG: hypothetical protein CGU29_11285 [Candidatus Dactylopiibacterium carminicum]|uniref:DUF4395 domain-containing protein n=1 Tax=Candidatus Dactylopiibacterium carminicum TaxID=857335 RepID=A0A272EQY2_9RHOO|nr:DUF4395 family protein [Candidatus Dactylopiibacterium carminicum]KAF7598697.1 DUF4395 domain-containing protein [Candidatus Dactylopiibacterium carminicum]PAS92515.1 MAG: hypothetical protein CGU29_11285 [Candidatus Dactylopiibacterium carminicum]PAS98564.1 MAG: hypothetical protein BSR46_11905 [Candidatus Dactylopiibacterium carminicum]
MLRFDIPPVWSNAVRLDALTTFLISAIALAGAPYLMFLLIVQGLVRGFFRHGLCPMHRVFTRVLKKLGTAGRQENAGATMFANKLLFIASSVATVLWLTGSVMWVVPVSVLMAFSFLEAAFSFCAACWAYTLWHRLRSR